MMIQSASSGGCFLFVAFSSRTDRPAFDPLFVRMPPPSPAPSSKEINLDRYRARRYIFYMFDHHLVWPTWKWRIHHELRLQSEAIYFASCYFHLQLYFRNYTLFFFAIGILSIYWSRHCYNYCMLKKKHPHTLLCRGLFAQLIKILIVAVQCHAFICNERRFSFHLTIKQLFCAWTTQVAMCRYRVSFSVSFH